MSGSLITKFIGRQTRNCTPGGMANIADNKARKKSSYAEIKEAANLALSKRGVAPSKFHYYNETFKKESP